MTPAEHLAVAEQLTAYADQLDGPGTENLRATLYTGAVAHASIASAVEAGAPHPAATAPGVPSA